MNDAERSIQSCVIGFAEFHRHVEASISNGQKATVRLNIQVALGRVLNTQIMVTQDCSPECTTPDEDATVSTRKSIQEHFGTWRDDLTRAIEERKVGWLRLAVSFDRGNLTLCNFNPSFDIKPG